MNRIYFNPFLGAKDIFFPQSEFSKGRMRKMNDFHAPSKRLQAQGRRIRASLLIIDIGERKRSRAVIFSYFLTFRVHWECSPCHFEYDLILHLEDVDKEYDYAWEKIADVKPVLRDQYKNSPMAKHHPSWYWRNVPKDVAKKIYMIYFMGKILSPNFPLQDILDLAGLGYSPEECMRYIDSASEADVLSLENIIKARSSLPKHELYLNQSYLHEVCY